MKAKSYFLVNDLVRSNAIKEINSLKIDGKIKITISNAGSKSTRQNSYQWRLYTDISKSGLGGRNEETPDSVHIKCKFLFALPVVLEKDENFRWLYEAVKKELDNDTEKLMWFVDKHVSTMDFNVSEGSDYIGDIINYYGPKGFQLTDPSNYNL